MNQIQDTINAKQLLSHIMGYEVAILAVVNFIFLFLNFQFYYLK